MNYLSGGGDGAARRCSASALLRERAASFAGYDDFSFAAAARCWRRRGEEADDDEAAARRRPAGGRQAAADAPTRKAPPRCHAEGPAEDHAARRAAGRSDLQRPERRGADRRAPRVRAVAERGGARPARPARGPAARGQVELHRAGARHRRQADQGPGASKCAAGCTQVISTRKRMVGGFYAYDNRTRGEGPRRAVQRHAATTAACWPARPTLDDGRRGRAGRAGARTRPAASRRPPPACGSRSRASCGSRRTTTTASTCCPRRSATSPARRRGCRCACRSAQATALVAVEREGVIDTRVVTLRGDDPTIELKIDKAWAPNVYVSVLVLRGRMRDVPWYSFFTWGWKRAAGLVARLPRTRAASTRRRPRWSTWPSPRSSSAWRRCRWAWPSTSCRSA